MPDYSHGSNRWMAVQAKLRPSDYPERTASEQWEIDKALGILDWNGIDDEQSTADEEPIRNRIMGRDGVMLLAALYRKDGYTVGTLCDVHLDPTGVLLFDVRAMARDLNDA